MKRMRLVCHPLTWAACVAALVLGGGGIAPAVADTSIQCGESITHSIVLQHDLLNCPGVGLYVVGDNVDVNLNGHTISGTYSSGVLTPGVWIVRYHDIVVRNGTIRGFGIGVDPMYIQHLTIKHLVLDGNYIGVYVYSSSHAVVHHNLVRGAVFEGHMALGIKTYGSDHVTFADNRLSNRLRGAIGVDASSYVDVLRNYENGAVTDPCPECNALSVTGSQYVHVVANALHNNPGTALYVSLGAASVTVSSNVIDHTRRSGMRIDKSDRRIVLLGNQAHDNGWDGIQVDATGTQITSNVANDNGWRGIEAVAGVVDGGGNIAHGNGGDQCVNVVCS